jgi:NHL repeat-containing protein
MRQCTPLYIMFMKSSVIGRLSPTVLLTFLLLVSFANAGLAACPVYSTKWGTFGSAPGQFSDPRGIAVSGGFVYVVETVNRRVQRFSLTGTSPTILISSGCNTGQLDYPYDITTDVGGNLYVTNTATICSGGNDSFRKYSSSGSLLLTVGTFGSGNGQFNFPTGIAVDTNGNVFVCDRNNNRVQKFNASGVYVGKVGGTAIGTGNGQFNKPLSVSTDPSGNVYVVDAVNHRIQKFSNSLSYISQNSSFVAPIGVEVDPRANHVLVTDDFKIKVLNLDLTATGDVCGGFGTGNDQFGAPRGMALTSDGASVFTVDAYLSAPRIVKRNYSGTTTPTIDITKCTIPTVLICPPAPDASGFLNYKTTIKNSDNSAAVGVTVQLTFSQSAEAALCFCSGQPHPSVSAKTNSSGIATFRILGGGSIVTTSAPVRVFLNGTLAKTVGVVSPDYNADCKVDLTDLQKHSLALSRGTYSFVSDFNGDGKCDLTDTVILDSPASVGARCSR